MTGKLLFLKITYRVIIHKLNNHLLLVVSKMESPGF